MSSRPLLELGEPPRSLSSLYETIASELAMAEISKCPQCERQLRVPDHLLGKKVKCPSCGTMFTAGAKKEIEVEAEVDDDDVQVDEEEIRKGKNRPARSEREEYEEEDRDDEQEEERRRKKKRRMASRKEAEARVMAPAISMLITGVFGILMGLFYLAIAIFDLNALGGLNRARIRSTNELVAGYAVAIVFLIWGIVVLLGALYLKNLRNFSTVMVATIFAMLPCNLCCVLGLPFGIWTLVVLNNADVKKSFS